MARQDAIRRVPANPFQDPLLERVRTLCLSLPEVSETASWNHPNFRAGRQAFLAFELLDGIAAVAFRLDPMEVERLERQQPFAPTPYGRGKWVSLPVKPRPGWALVRDLVLRSYRMVASPRMHAELDRRRLG